MGAIRQFLSNYTTEDYERWKGRWEIINGLAVSMSPMPNPRHQYISGLLNKLLLDAVEKSKCGHCKVYQPIDYRINDSTIVNPDLLIVCKPIEGQYLEFPPALVVEILSPSTALKDKNTKYDLYQREGVKYYIMIDPSNDSIEIFYLDNEGKYQLTNTNDFDLGDCKIKVDLHKCFD